MAQKTTSATIIDHVDGQPSIILANGNWGVFDPKTKEYKDTGVKATAIDDNAAVKYFKLTNTSTSPTAPNKAGGYANIKPELDNALVADGWSLDPLTPSKDNKFCWIAVYGMENLPDVEATQTNGAMTFKQKFTMRTVGLWANYAESSTITVEDGVITIKNPDGTTTSQQFVTKEKADDLTTMVNALQAQVDGAIYSYSMEGVPTMDKAPVTDWRIDADLSDTALIADIYKTHVGDTYTDTLTYFSYRFTQTGASASNPAHYGWKIIENDALTAALGEIANLGNTKMTIFTVKPDHGKYKAGDMWLQSDNTMMVAIADGNNMNFNTAHWIQPFATKAEVSAVQSDLDSAKADAQATANNLNDLNDSLGSLTDGVGKAIKDNIITAAELRDLQTFSDALDVEQAKMLSTVTYLLGSKFLPSANNSAIVAVKARFLDTGGSIDQLQDAILGMDANNDGVIDDDERANYNTKLGIYKGHATEMENAVSDARKAIDLRLEAITDEKVDGIEIGGRNLIVFSEMENGSFNYNSGINVGGSVNYQARTKELIKVNPNSSYYLWTNMEPLEDGDMAIEIAYTLFDKNKDPIRGSGRFVSEKIIKVTGETEYIRVRFGGSGAAPWDDNTRFLLTRSTIATDWTPAPEDVQSNIDAAKKAGTDASAEVVSMGDSLTTMVNTVTGALEDKVIDEAERKTLIAEQKTLDTEQERLLALVNSLLESAYLVGDANTALSDASNATLKASTGTLDVYQMTIDVMINAVKITDPMISAYEGAYDNHKNGLSSLNVAIENARKAIDIEVKRLSDEKVDNIEIGGRNLLLNSREIDLELPLYSESTFEEWTTSTDGIKDIKLGTNHRVILRLDDLVVGKKYSFSFKFNRQWNSQEFYVGVDGVEDTFTSITGALLWHQKSLTFTASSESTTAEIWTIYPTANWTIAFKEFKLEKGNKATDWGPAPEDVQASIDEAVIKATYWSIKSSSPVIYKDSNSATASGVHTPVTVNGELRSGTTTTQGGFISIQPNGGAESTATASPRTIAPTNAEGKTSYTVRLYEKADKVALLDTMTIPVVFKGSSGINVAMSNEADVLPASPTGEVTDYADTSNIIRAFEGANELQYSATAGNGKYNVTGVGTGIIVGAKSASGLACSFANASNMTTDSAKIVFTISGKTSDGTSFSFDKTQNFSKSKIGADGAEGEDALSVQLHRQGSFRTWWQQVSDTGTILTKPKKVSEIVGGVTVAGVQYVEVKAVIYKGSRDVTSIAMKSLAQGGGGDFKWFIVGGPNPGQKASGVDRLLLSVDYADGLDDEVQFEYNDANAKMW